MTLESGGGAVVGAAVGVGVGVGVEVGWAVVSIDGVGASCVKV